MNKILRLLPIMIVSFASVALAQTVTADGTGMANNVPLYSGSTTLTSSILYQAGTSVGGGIGINTSTPQYSLDIHGGAAYTPVGINIYNWFGDPEGASLENITFSGGANPTGFAMIEAGGDPTCWSCGAGYLAFKTANGGAILNEGMRLNAGGQLGIGTTGPQSALHVASAAVALAANGGPFGNGNVVIQGLGGRSTSAGASLSFATAANTDGSNVWEQARILATADNVNNGDASGRLYLQTRTVSGSTWVWNNNLVLNSSGYVGVGTPSSPTQPLEVNGSIKIDSGGLMFADGTSLSSASALAGTSLPADIVTSSLTSVGTVTSGTWNASPLTSTYLPADVDYTDQAQTISGQKTFTSGVSVSAGEPGTPFTVQGSALGSTSGNTTALMTLQNSDANANYLSFSQYRNANGSYWNTATTRIQTVTDVTAQGYIDFNPPNGQYGLAMGSGSSEYFRIAAGGNIGIGTTNPGAMLDVAGNVKISGPGASLTFPGGSVQSVAWDGTTYGQDYAEAIDIKGDRAKYEPGDVMVIDDSETRKFDKSDKAYSKMVAGVFSTKPGLLARRGSAAIPTDDDEVPMAMMGIVPTKVCSENGPIERGDLLVSSSTPGYAMKGTDRDRLMGAVIGKALAPLKSGSGVIEVLLALQ